MAVENLKSTAITNLDASPIVSNTSGIGSPAVFRNNDGFVTISASASAGSTYRMVRVPSNAIIKSVNLETEAQGAGAVNVSAYYSDSTTDGTKVSNIGLIVPTTGDQFWASDVDISAALKPTDVTNESGNNPIANRQKRLWDALGLTTDPGGFFDFVLVVHTTAITTGTGKTYLRVSYAEAA